MRDKKAEKVILFLVIGIIILIAGLFFLGRTLDHHGIGEPTAEEKTRLTNTIKGDAND